MEVLFQLYIYLHTCVMCGFLLSHGVKFIPESICCERLRDADGPGGQMYVELRSAASPSR